MKYLYYNITDTEKLLVMTKVFPKLFINQKEFAKNIGENPQTVNSWLNLKTKNLKAIPKSEICRIFGLMDLVWVDNFPTEDEFRDVLKRYKKIVKRINIFMKKEENNTIEMTLFEEAKKYKKINKIEEALENITKIESSSSSFKYIYHNEIQHLKAILLSDDTIQDWDKAIDILRNLYFASKYHLEKPEIITLIASNYKRKALYSGLVYKYRDKKDVDMGLIAQALTLYDEAYELKDSQERYYDAINWAYLYNIASVLESNRLNIIRVKERFEELKRAWRVNEKDWWEVVSYAEFSMLIGDVEFAKSYIDDFLESYSIKPFDTKTTLRQIRLYIHFTQDKNAIEFYKHIKTSLENL